MNRTHKAEALERAYRRTVDHNVRGVLAVDAAGVPVDPLDPEAVRWCAIGAIRRELGASPGLAACTVLGVPAEHTITVLKRNDCGGDLRAAFDELIAALPPDEAATV
jgi:hypothetical protein